MSPISPRLHSRAPSHCREHLSRSRRRDSSFALTLLPVPFAHGFFAGLLLLFIADAIHVPLRVNDVLVPIRQAKAIAKRFDLICRYGLVLVDQGGDGVGGV